MKKEISNSNFNTLSRVLALLIPVLLGCCLLGLFVNIKKLTANRRMQLLMADKLQVPPESPAVPSNDGAEMRERWASEIIDKQYRLYTWNDGKLQALATINGLLVAAIGFLFKEGPNNWYAQWGLLLSLLLLFVSMSICLWRLRNFPQSNRTKASWSNLRSISGIMRFEKWEDYRDEFKKSDRERFLDDSVRQIYGMAFNNRRGHFLMEIAVWFTISGTLMLTLASGAHFIGPKDMGTAIQQSGATSPTVARPKIPVKTPTNGAVGTKPGIKKP